MRVEIIDAEYSYDSDYTNVPLKEADPLKRWLISSGDAFRFPVRIGRTDCFVKRFERKALAEISGSPLMLQLKSMPTGYFPTVYDIVSVKEDGTNVFYAFYEYLPGNTLDNILAGGPAVRLPVLLDHIAGAIRLLRTHEFWFSDFCEKNIYCSKDRFLLIDMDTTIPFTQMPTNDIRVNQEFLGLVANFYTRVLKQPGFHISQLNGVNLNILQLVFLILKLHMFQLDKSRYIETKFSDKLPFYLDNASAYFKGWFRTALANGNTPFTEIQLNELVGLVKEKILGAGSFEIATKEISIDQFSIAGTEEVDGMMAMQSGKEYTLQWAVSNAGNVEYSVNGVVQKKLTASGTMPVQLSCTGTRSCNYKLGLRAYNDGVDVVKESKLKVLVQPAAATQPHEEVADPQPDGPVKDSGKTKLHIEKPVQRSEETAQRSDEPAKNNEKATLHVEKPLPHAGEETVFTEDVIRENEAATLHTEKTVIHTDEPVPGIDELQQPTENKDQVNNTGTTGVINQEEKPVPPKPRWKTPLIAAGALAVIAALYWWFAISNQVRLEGTDINKVHAKAMMMLKGHNFPYLRKDVSIYFNDTIPCTIFYILSAEAINISVPPLYDHDAIVRVSLRVKGRAVKSPQEFIYYKY